MAFMEIGQQQPGPDNAMFNALLPKQNLHLKIDLRAFISTSTGSPVSLLKELHKNTNLQFLAV
jgi:hypothetical protein